MLGIEILTALTIGTNAHAQLTPPPISPATTSTFEYEPDGSLKKIWTNPTAENGGANAAVWTSYGYDFLMRPKSRNNAPGYSTVFAYDGSDNLTKVTDPRGLMTEYQRNGLGDTLTLTNPDTGTASHTYDTNGNIRTRTDSRGVLSSYVHDELNRLTSVVHSKAGQNSLSYSWEYDLTGADYGAGIGRLSRTDHPAGATRYVYDAYGRVTTDFQRINPAAGGNSGNVVLLVTYSYDTSGHLVGITYPSGRKLSLSYSSQGQLSGMGLAKDSGAAASPLISQIQWVPYGGVQGWQWNMAAGLKPHFRSYDTSGRLVRYPLGGVYRDLRYDEVNHITSYTHRLTADGTPQNALDQSFLYDGMGQLTDIRMTGTTWNIRYDRNGNRTQVNLNGVGNAYTMSNTSNRLASSTSPARSFTYDEAGNTVRDTGKGYTATYDLSSRLETVSKAGITTRYSYDGLGRRIRKISSTGVAGTVLFAYGPADELLGEYDSNGKALREYVWLEGAPIAILTPDPTNSLNPPIPYFIHADHLGTPRIVVDRNDKRRWRWLADPFGTAAPETNPENLGTFAQNLRFPGQYSDQESGLNYNYFRYYDPSTGRYVQSDPIGLRGGVNTYSYVYGNPLRYVDPLGLYTEVVYWHGVGGGGSQFGHISTNINGQNYSWTPPGQWDTKYPLASDYNARQQTFRDGSGVMLNLTPEQEKALAACMSGASGSYSLTSNNCGTSVQDCLQKVGVQFNQALRPISIYESLRNSPSAIGNTSYPGPARSGGPLDNPFVWGY